MRLPPVLALLALSYLSCAAPGDTESADDLAAQVAPCAPTTGISYATVAVGSGVLRTMIVKRDATRGLCTRLSLIDGASPRSGFDVDINAPHVAIERAWIDRDLEHCNLPNPSPSPSAVRASAATGTIRMQRSPRCALDVDVTLTFAPSTPDMPDTDRLQVLGIDSAFACLVSGRSQTK